MPVKRRPIGPDNSESNRFRGQHRDECGEARIAPPQGGSEQAPTKRELKGYRPVPEYIRQSVRIQLPNISPIECSGKLSDVAVAVADIGACGHRRVGLNDGGADGNG